MRLYALTLTAAVVGLAGALLTFMLQGVYADNLSWQHAGDSLLMTVLGGVHHFLGPLWGAIALHRACRTAFPRSACGTSARTGG